MGSVTALSALKAIIVFIIMMAVGIGILGNLWNYTNSETNLTVEWLLKMSIFICFVVGCFAVPILIAQGAQLDARDILFGMLYMFVLVPIIKIITDVCWNINENFLKPADPSAGFWVSFFLLLLTGILCFFVPTAIMLGGTKTLEDTLEGASE